MLTLLAAAALAPVKFPGGNPNDFAALLAESAKQSVVVVQGEGQTVDPCEYDTSDLNELARALRNQTKLMIMPGTDLVLSDGYLARELVRETKTRLRGGTAEERAVIERIDAIKPPNYGLSDAEKAKYVSMSPVPLPAKAVQNGAVTFQTQKNESLDLETLSGVLSKPVKTHWIFNTAVVCCKVDNMPELDFLKWIAKGVGGRVLTGAKDYTLDIDPGEIRRRAIKTISLEKPQAGTREDTVLKFRIAALNGLTPAQISAALESQGGETKVELAQRGPLTQTAVAYVQQMEQLEAASGVAGGGNVRRPPRTSVLQRVDPSRKAYLIVNAQFGATVEVPVLNGQGQPAGVVRF